jgi:hypothetical protein
MAGGQGGHRSIAEAALEAWVDCRPEGYSLDAEHLLELLPTIASHVPNRSPGARVKELSRLFAARGGHQPVFMRLLRIQDERVHFLYFWRAFSEAARMADGTLDDGLTAELETLRDGLLRMLEEPGRCHDSHGSVMPLDRRSVPTFALIGELHRTAAMSAQPRFWSTAAEMLAELVRDDELAVDCVTSVMFTWLREAALWEQRVLRRSESNMWTDLQHWLVPSSTSQGRLVRLNIYDVSQSESVQKLNSIFAHQNAPLKLLGVFHAGVEVDGLEWSFGYIVKQTGVVCSKPREHRQHHYRQTLELRPTQLDPDKIAQIISELIEEYPGEGYDLLRRNCCHFADDFCQRLGIGNIPGWVYRLARIAANVDTVLKKAQAIRQTARSMKNNFYSSEPVPKARPWPRVRA